MSKEGLGPFILYPTMMKILAKGLFIINKVINEIRTIRRAHVPRGKKTLLSSHGVYNILDNACSLQLCRAKWNQLMRFLENGDDIWTWSLLTSYTQGLLLFLHSRSQ
jgi:hypothetical protein